MVWAGVQLVLSQGIKADFLDFTLMGLGTLWMAVFANVGVTFHGVLAMLPGMPSMPWPSPLDYITWVRFSIINFCCNDINAWRSSSVLAALIFFCMACMPTPCMQPEE